ncbi:MAG TPA: ABATE domain-containing protein, partial [Longimicrobiales bacterium]|nr:ABATE domain-containing protein [Longimicrobiales bacterium]
MELVGGDVCLDFVNTASGRENGVAAEEKLGGYEDLVTWAERVELVGPERAGRLRRVASATPGRARAALKSARELREAIHRVFSAAEPSRTDVEILGEWAGKAAAERRLVAVAGGFAFGWPESDALEQVLWPVALSAAELLTSEERARVKECAGETCDWLFLDMSRNR